MRRHKKQFVFKGVDASQITKLEECTDLLHKVETASNRANKLIKRRQEEVEKLHKIQEDLTKRIDFLSVSDIELNTWYDHKTEQRRFFCLSVKGDNLQGWEFDLQNNNATSRNSVSGSVISLDYRTHEIFLSEPLSSSAVAASLNEKHQYVASKVVAAKQVTYSIKGEKSFLSLWAPSNGLSQALKDPDILTIKSTLDEMWEQNSPRRLSKEGKYDDNCRSEIYFAKHQDKWYVVLFVG